MSQLGIPLKQIRFMQTSRRDAWWLPQVLTVLGLGAFIVYSTWAAFQGSHYHYAGNGAHYLSPFYSPLLFDTPGVNSGHAILGQRPTWWPTWLAVSPALLILWAPGGFRFTCYYYRGAYYKAFWMDPPSCAVGEPRGTYWGENSFPLILQNLHRYFLYLAILFIVILITDVYHALWFTDAATGRARLGVGVGTLVLALNVVLLASYTFGCHSLRHLIGGGIDQLSRHPVRAKLYGGVSCLNARHMRFAWLSLFSVGFSDVYVRMCSMGVWTDYVLFRL
ncbi:hypothetical protein RAS1_18770 [Phycisphaerae bacterium RAS1]|nr:hypothetical protein RAS1_18770 [Phycisphaerae bacterium RAS1]